MFKPVDPNKNIRMVSLFRELCDECEIKNSYVLSMCYKNRIELNCKYSQQIEKILDTIHTLVMKREGPEHWVSLLD